MLQLVDLFKPSVVVRMNGGLHGILNAKLIILALSVIPAIMSENMTSKGIKSITFAVCRIEKTLALRASNVGGLGQSSVYEKSPSSGLTNRSLLHNRMNRHVTPSVPTVDELGIFPKPRHQGKCTGHMPALPIVAQWTYNHIWMLYGLLTAEFFPLFTTYAVGSGLSITFLAIFYYASTRDHRSYVLQLTASALLFNAATSCYAFLGPQVQKDNQVVQITGFVAIGCGIALYASPFATMRDVIRTKCSASIPFGMVAMGTISNATWIVYGSLTEDWFIVGPTVVNTVLCFAQLLLYVAYRSPSRRKALGRSEFGSDSLSDSTFPHSQSPCSDKNSELSFVLVDTPKTVFDGVADLA